MSDFRTRTTSKCNRCNLNELCREHAKHEGFVIKPMPRADFPDGVGVMCLDEEIAWYMMLPYECVCGHHIEFV